MITESELNTLLNVNSKTTEQKVSIDTAIHNLKNLTHTQTIFLSNEEVIDIHETICYLEKLTDKVKVRQEEYKNKLIKIR